MLDIGGYQDDHSLEPITMTQFIRIMIYLYLAYMIGGCAGLPEYAKPKKQADGEFSMADAITYRRLARTDFKAEHPPGGFDERMAAVTCASVKWHIDKQSVQYKYAKSEDGGWVVSVKAKNPVFRAYMDRNCSWWNPKSTGLGQFYLLEHEQIHFAFYEIAARRWNKEIHTIEFQIKESDQQAMSQDIISSINRFLEPRYAALDKRNLEFDEDTSMAYRPKKHKRWLDTVRQELSALGYSGAASIVSDCQVDEATRQAIAKAKRLLSDTNYNESMIKLIEQAEAYLEPPDCYSSKARILAERAIAMARNSTFPCLVTAETRRAINAAVKAADSKSGKTEALRLISLAKDAIKPPNCDNVRARILAEKAYQLITEN